MIHSPSSCVASNNALRSTQNSWLFQILELKNRTNFWLMIIWFINKARRFVDIVDDIQVCTMYSIDKAYNSQLQLLQMLIFESKPSIFI